MKESQLGRSMVEMLAVLAIIGILSIGGIAGYDAVVTNNKTNAVLDAISKIAAIARTKGMTTTNESAMLTLPEGVLFIKAEPTGLVTVEAPVLSDSVYRQIKNALQSRMPNPGDTKASFVIDFGETE